MGLECKKVKYNNQNYAVVNMKYKDLNLPAVLDWDEYLSIKDIDKSWKCHKNGFISCQHRHEGSIKDVFMHELIMVLKNQKNNQEGQNKPILHINRIGLDNRIANVEYKSSDPSLRNTKKKKRTIKLPEGSGIDVDSIPTYVWYLKPNGTHGARFSVEIGDIKWKTTASKSVPLSAKLESAKSFLRQLKQQQPEIFEERSMNGDLSKKGAVLIKQYRDIIRRAGYDNVIINTKNNNTRQLIGVRRPVADDTDDE